jgi:hypothetical protein
MEIINVAGNRWRVTTHRKQSEESNNSLLMSSMQLQNKAILLSTVSETDIIWTPNALSPIKQVE